MLETFFMWLMRDVLYLSDHLTHTHTHAHAHAHTRTHTYTHKPTQTHSRPHTLTHNHAHLHTLTHMLLKSTHIYALACKCLIIIASY